MIEIVTNFYSAASPDAADLITKHAIKMNRQVQMKSGKVYVKKEGGPGKVTGQNLST